jgi:hypothetical protein
MTAQKLEGAEATLQTFEHECTARAISLTYYHARELMGWAGCMIYCLSPRKCKDNNTPSCWQLKIRTVSLHLAAWLGQHARSHNALVIERDRTGRFPPLMFVVQYIDQLRRTWLFLIQLQLSVEQGSQKSSPR